MGLERPDSGPEMPDLVSERSDLGYERPEMCKTGRPRAICGQRYPLPCFALRELEWEEAGQRPRRGRSPVEHRGLSFVRSFVCSFVRPPQALTGLKSALSGLKSTLSDLKSALSSLEFA